MLADYDAVPTLAVSDLQRARGFYEGVLGYTAQMEAPEGAGVYYTAGSGGIFVYTSAYAGTNKATAVSIRVPDASFDAEVSALRDRDIQFQTFDMEGTTWNDGVATFGDNQYRSVWFEDPDGNIINLETGSTMG